MLVSKAFHNKYCLLILPITVLIKLYYFVLRKISILDRVLRLPTILLLVQFSREPAV